MLLGRLEGVSLVAIRSAESNRHKCAEFLKIISSLYSSFATHVQHDDAMAAAAERVAALETRLAQKDASVEGSTTALAAVQKKHAAALEALLTDHAATVKKMQASLLYSPRTHVIISSLRILDDGLDFTKIPQIDKCAFLVYKPS